MKTIIAGGRFITDYSLLLAAIKESGFHITQVVSGHCRGVDRMGEWWARDMNIDLEIMDADWDRQGRKAGPLRNQAMADYAEAAILIWDGKSRGTGDMYERALKNGLKIYVKTPPTAPARSSQTKTPA
jgi:SLOG family YspA-like protein